MALVAFNFSFSAAKSSGAAIVDATAAAAGFGGLTGDVGALATGGAVLVAAFGAGFAPFGAGVVAGLVAWVAPLGAGALAGFPAGAASLGAGEAAVGFEAAGSWGLVTGSGV